MKLSIIIPYYNTFEYTRALLEGLEQQIEGATDEVEIIVVDDGCHETRLDEFKKCKIIHCEENGGLSVARNIGLENSTGDYIVYIDSDDDVSSNYIRAILVQVSKTEFDCCYFGWSAMHTYLRVMITDKPPSWNWAVWNAVYKRDLIEPFEGRKFEDVAWQEKMRPKFKVIRHIPQILYYYNNGREGSITDLHSKGLN